MAQEAAAGDAAALIKLFGETVQGKDGDVQVSSLVGNDVIGVYFSAHWCPPCRGFTPKLIDVYKKLTKDGKKFQIIFVSSDRDKSAFDEYYSEMPWLALKFSDRKRKAKLSKKFKVSGIPSFQLIDPQTGKIVNDEGRSAVANPENYPWKKAPPQPFFETIKDVNFQAKDGSKVTVEQLRQNKFLMLYFSAHWCPPCRGFTPKYVEWYNKNHEKLKGTDRSFETVFVSSDRDQNAFDEYWKEQPWLAMPYDERKLKGTVSDAFDVQGIPSLIVLDCETGSVVTDGGRSGVMGDEDAKDFPWPKKAAEYLTGSNVAPINDTPMLVVFADKGPSAEEQAAALAAVLEVAQPLLDKAKAEDEDMEVEFRVEKGDSGFGDRLRGLGAKEGEIAFIFDIGERKGYNCSSITSMKDVTTANLQAFVTSFITEKLEGRDLSM